MKIEKFKNQKFTTGFTLIELMVSVSIFLIVAFVVTSVFITALDAYRKAKQISFLVDNLNYAFDRMVINLREGTDYVVSGNPPETKIDFKDLENNPHIYGLYSSAIGEKYIVECIPDYSNCTQLTDKKIDINKLTFTEYPTPSSGGSVRPPMVRINAQSTITQRNIVTTINLQTTVTQRNSD